MTEGETGTPVDRGQPAVRDARRRAGTKTALVVDDEAVIRRLVRSVLRRRGFTILEAADGRAAVRQVFEHHGRLDLLITDLQMPGLNGLEVAAMVTLARPATAVVLMTGDPAALAGAETGVPGPVLRKPFSTEELLQAVAEALAGAG